MTSKTLVRTAVTCSVMAAFLLPTRAAGEDLAPTCANALTNLGFESGSFSGWSIQDLAQPFCAMGVVGAGGGCFGFANQPTEGVRAARHGWDGGGPGTIRFAQDLAVQKASSLTMQFDYRAAWINSGSQSRTFYVDIEPPGGGTPLQTTLIHTAANGTQNLDTGNLRGTVDLSPFVGQSVRVSFEAFVPQNFTGPAHLQVDNIMPLLPHSGTVDGNGVFEPGEIASVRPGWLNCSTLAAATTGTATTFTGPGGSSYVILDGTADYGTVPAGSSLNCQGTGNCYALSISSPPARPSLHWDAALREQLSRPGRKDWAIHVGASFADVPTANPFYRFIETLLHAGVTGGCNATDYCPATPTSRDQMAVFVLVAKEGAGYAPPACGATPMFADVPVSNPFCRWIEELARRAVVSGCGGGNYCPGDPVTREQMAIFVLRTLDPALNPPACSAPPFNDVPTTSPFCRWITELVTRGIVTGCGGGNYCPLGNVTREQMGVFISATFSLTLYGP